MNSDPGTSGLLSPFAKIDGLYFDNSKEPCDLYYQLSKDLKKKYLDKGYKYIGLEFDNADDFYDALKALSDFATDNITVYGTSKEGVYNMVINEDADMDEQTRAVSTVAKEKEGEVPKEKE